MTPQEIQALINAKIAGQGSAVDVGGALPQILSGILDLIGTTTAPATKISVNSVTPTQYESESEALSRLSINGETPTKQQLLELYEKMPNVVLENKFADSIFSGGPVSYFAISPNSIVIYGGYYLDEDYFFVFQILIDGDASKIDLRTV